MAIGTMPADAKDVRQANAAVSQTAGTSGATDFSAQRRRGRGRYYGGAAAGALAAGVIGSAIIASQSRGYGYYDRPYGYGYGYGGPRYYGRPGYYDGW